MRYSRIHILRNYCYSLLGFLALLYLPLQGNELDIFETPTALSLERGEYQINTYFYKDGGILLRGGVGASRYFNFGLIEYFDNIIGTNISTPAIPHAYAKVRIPLPSGKISSLDLALGYDAIYRGNFFPFSEKLYGIYGVLTLGVPWFANTLLAPHYISFGFRYPIIFKIDTPDVFFSLYFRFNNFFQIASEVSNIHLGRASRYRFLNNNAIILGLGYNISLKAVLQVSGTITGDKYSDISSDLGLSLVLGFRNFF